MAVPCEDQSFSAVQLIESSPQIARIPVDELEPLYSDRDSSYASGEEDNCIGAKRSRCYSNSLLNPKRPRTAGAGSVAYFSDGLGAYSSDDSLSPPSMAYCGMSPPSMTYSTIPAENAQIWVEIVEQPEEYYRARYASEGSRGPLKGKSLNSFPKVMLRTAGSLDYVTGSISVSLVHDDATPHCVCSLTSIDEDMPSTTTAASSNTVKRIAGPDFTAEFDQLRIKRDKHLGAKGRKQKLHTQRDSIGHLRFDAVIETQTGQSTYTVISNPIKLTAKPESAELHAIKNDYGSVEGGDEVWIRGSKMISNPKVLFEFRDAQGKMHSYSGIVSKDDSHQNLLVVKTPKIPCCEQVMAEVVVMTGKEKLRSNSLQFQFLPPGQCEDCILDNCFTHSPTTAAACGAPQFLRPCSPYGGKMCLGSPSNTSVGSPYHPDSCPISPFIMVPSNNHSERITLEGLPVIDDQTEQEILNTIPTEFLLN